MGWLILCNFFQELLSSQILKFKKKLDVKRYVKIVLFDMFDFNEVDYLEVIEL